MWYDKQDYQMADLVKRPREDFVMEMNGWKKPKMILFDYGQTLVNERKFDGVKGTAAVMEYAVSNPHGRTAEEIQAEATAILTELGRIGAGQEHVNQVEVSDDQFYPYLYQSNGIELSISYREAERIFWDHASPAVITDGIEEFLAFLRERNIRTAVISNLSYSQESLKMRIAHFLPNNHFEFVIASSEYIFRKPNPRIFKLALEKAGLQAEDCWYVGDSYQCDMVGARNVGMRGLWYTGAMGEEKRAEARNTEARNTEARNTEAFMGQLADKDYVMVSSWKELEREILLL